VAVPWWCCNDSPTGPTGATGATGASAGIEEAAGTVEQVLREPAPAKEGCVSASQLLMQRYMIANPPRGFGKPAGHAAAAPEIIDCPDCEDGEPSPQFAAAMSEFQRTAVLIPSEET